MSDQGPTGPHTPKPLREFVRLKNRLLAVVTHSTSGHAQRVLTTDIGVGGMLIVTEERLSPGTPLRIALHLPDRSAPIRLTAEVVWSKPSHERRRPYETPSAETGVRFVTLQPGDRVSLMHYAKANAAS